jgi:hypothetical protein
MIKILFKNIIIIKRILFLNLLLPLFLESELLDNMIPKLFFTLILVEQKKSFKTKSFEFFLTKQN